MKNLALKSTLLSVALFTIVFSLVGCVKCGDHIVVGHEKISDKTKQDWMPHERIEFLTFHNAEGDTLVYNLVEVDCQEVTISEEIICYEAEWDNQKELVKGDRVSYYFKHSNGHELRITSRSGDSKEKIFIDSRGGPSLSGRVSISVEKKAPHTIFQEALIEYSPLATLNGKDYENVYYYDRGWLPPNKSQISLYAQRGNSIIAFLDSAEVLWTINN